MIFRALPRKAAQKDSIRSSQDEASQCATPTERGVAGASRLSAAHLQIGTSLDLDALLRKLVDSGRALTGARYGAITIGGEGDTSQRLLSSSLTPTGAVSSRVSTFARACRSPEHACVSDRRRRLRCE